MRINGMRNISELLVYSLLSNCLRISCHLCDQHCFLLAALRLLTLLPRSCPPWSVQASKRAFLCRVLLEASQKTQRLSMLKAELGSLVTQEASMQQDLAASKAAARQLQEHKQHCEERCALSAAVILLPPAHTIDIGWTRLDVQALRCSHCCFAAVPQARVG